MGRRKTEKTFGFAIDDIPQQEVKAPKIKVKKEETRDRYASMMDRALLKRLRVKAVSDEVSIIVIIEKALIAYGV